MGEYVPRINGAAVPLSQSRVRSRPVRASNLVLLLPLAIQLACASSTVSDPDGSAPPDGQTSADAGNRVDTGVPEPDAGAVGDAGAVADAGVEADAGAGADSGTAPDAASGIMTCDRAADVDGLITGSMNLARVFLPTSATPQTLSPIVETGAFVSLGVTRVRGATVDWHAQASSLTMFGDLSYEHVIIDPQDGSVYAAMSTQLQDSTSRRFYHADGTLFREYTPGGAPGSDLVGSSRQSNFFLVKYSSAGVIQWISRFGPNSNGTVAGSISMIGLVGDHVRVVADVEGGTTIAFAAGAPSQFSRTVPTATVFWGEFQKADGNYAADSAHFITATNRTSQVTTTPQGHFAHSASGETAIQARLRKETQPLNETFTIGTATVTVTATRSTVAFVKVAAWGDATVQGTLTIPRLFGAGGDPRSVALGPTGQLVAGGQFSNSESTAYFRGTTGLIRMETLASHSYLVSFDPAGALLWAVQIPGQRNAISRILVTADAIYVLGTHEEGEQIGTITVPASGYAVTRHSLSTGEAEWVRVFAPAEVGALAATYEIWQRGAELVFPSVFNGIRVVGGTVDQRWQPPAGTALGALYLSPAGDLLRCEIIATNAAGLRHF